MKRLIIGLIFGSTIVFLSGRLLLAQEIYCPAEDSLRELYKNSRKIDLKTSKSPSVVALRNIVKISAPETNVLVKTFSRESLPDELRPVFATKGIVGVTMCGRYIAILRSPFPKEEDDVLNHELVHAYISLKSPKRLPFWFQEASAVYFSTDTHRNVYGKPSGHMSGVTELKVVELPRQYQQKLQSFHFLIERVGKDKFYKWYAHTVACGIVDSRPLLGLSSAVKIDVKTANNSNLIWILGGVGIVLLIGGICGFYAIKHREEF